jgi:hypothetical protein
MDVSKLLDELGATGEDRTAVERFFSANPNAAQKASDWRENGLRQSDYDRKMNMLKAEVTAEKTRISEAETQLAASRDTMNSQYTQALRDREEAQNRLAAVSARITRVATEYQVPVTEFGLDAAGTTPPNPAVTQPAREPNPNNNGQFVSRADFDSLTDLTKRLPMLPVDIMAAERDYRKAFGNDDGFDPKAVINKALELQRPVAEAADLLYGIGAKQKERYEATIRQDERAKADAEWKTKVSQNAANPMRTDLTQAPGVVFNLKRPEITGGTPGPRPDRTASGVEGAVAAFREGKYRATPAA